MNFGQALIRLRKKTIYSQIDVAKKLKITPSYMSQLENDKKKPSLTMLEKFATFYDIPLPLLFYFTVDEKDVKKEKLLIYKKLKPNIDDLIEMVFLK